MRAHLEDDELAILDAAPERPDEASRGDNILSAERDLRRRFDPAELAKRVMGDECVRLTKEGVDRLFGRLRTKAASCSIYSGLAA